MVSVYALDAAAVALERARLWQRLDSAHCPQFLDEVELASGTAIVTPWLSCGSLQALLERRRLRAGEAVTILVPLAQLLARLHSLGAAHGDVRVSNVHFDERGTPILLGWRNSVCLPDAVLDAEPHAVSGAMPPFAEDARGYVALSREVLGRSLLTSERVRDLLAAEFAVGTAEMTARFFREAEQALFTLGDARPIDPLVPYDWGAESSQALARVDEAVRSDVEKQLLARSPRARVRSARAVVTQTVAASPRALLAASVRVRRAGGVRPWPGSRNIVRLKTLGIAATVCAVAVIGALVATPTSTTSQSSSASQHIFATPAGSLPSGSSSAYMPPDGTPSAGTPSAIPPAAGTSSVAAAAPGTSSPTTGVSTATSPARATSISAESGGSAPSTAEGASFAPATVPADASPSGPLSEAALSGPAPSAVAAPSTVAPAPGAEAAGSDSTIDAAISGDDPAVALVALLQRRDYCFRQQLASCFDGVDQSQSPALAADQQELGDAVRTGANPSQLTVAPGSAAGTGSTSSGDDGGDEQSIQRVGDAAVARVWVSEANGTTATAAEAPRPPLAPSALLADPHVSVWAVTHTAPSRASAVNSASAASGVSTASEPPAIPSAESGSPIAAAAEVSSGVGSVRKQPASALLVKEEAGWSIRAVFMPAG